MKIVTLYNHKGGVSKTTTTFNLLHFLADQGKKVLVVDADPQCNMTELCLSQTIATLDEQNANTGVIQELPGTSLLDILRPRIDGNIAEIDVDAIKTVQVTQNIDIIRGSVELNAIEDSIAEAHSQRFSTKTHEKQTYVAISDMLTRFGQKRNYDYIFLDVGPSSGALTRSCFLACDGFFIPVAPDRFNVQAIQTLSIIIRRWLTEHSQVVKDFKTLGLPVAIGKPIFLGAISQFFKLHGGKPKPAYQMWMDRIPTAVNECLIPVLKDFSTLERDLTGGIDEKNSIVTEIPDFGSLAPCMQECGKAVFQITQNDTAAVDRNGQRWVGATWTDAEERMGQYKAKFEAIGERLKYLP